MRDVLRRAEDGALVFEEWPSGAVYLLDGCVAHVETSDVPDLGERLVAAGRLSAAQWAAVPAGVDDGDRLADLLSRHGVDRHEVAALTESVLVDSILALLAGPTAGAGPGRFLAGARPAVDAELRLDEAAVQDVLAQRPEGSMRSGIRSTSVVEPAPPAWRWRVLTADEWRVLCRIGERARIRDLARAEGLGVYEVVDQVAELVRAGLCAVRPDPTGPDPRPWSADGPPRREASGAGGSGVVEPAVGTVEGSVPAGGAERAVDGPVDGDPLAALPRRVPGGALSPATVLQKSLAVRPLGIDVPEPDEWTLRRLLGSLQQMD
ncbi:hypothetical protein [Pseudonocardia humida]|uniref:Uncharacterized protein n=1 Tax=Pseudonocardia humida TaxID=2800819 RepID=A0ABT1A6L4_9PSEU|nr:hypothetical protein [Pseudonocardia humida]MCO1658662.1 hypothetical protein [Pseudonocardia humida]